jgi:hypothetical protein
MEKLAFKRLETESEINSYLDKFENCVDVRLPIDYANNSNIVGVFLHDRLVGGYMIVTGPNFRSLLFIPDSIKNQNPFFQHELYEMMEVNGVWIGPAIKTAKQQFTVWMHIIRDIFLTKKKFVLLMGDARNKNISQIHNMTSPVKLYEGPPNLMIGDNSHQVIRVSYSTRWNMLKGLHKYWSEYKSRELRPKHRISGKSSNQPIEQSRL